MISETPEERIYRESGWQPVSFDELGALLSDRFEWDGLVQEAKQWGARVWKTAHGTAYVAFPEWTDDHQSNERLSDFRVRFIAKMREMGLEVEW